MESPDSTTVSKRFREALSIAGSSAIFCAAIHVAVAPIWRKALGQQKYASLQRREQLYLAEKTVSSVNALLVGGSALWIIGSGEYSGDVFNVYTKGVQYCLGFYSGYSIYDTTVMALGAHEKPIMWLHHVLGLAGAVAMMTYREMSFVPMSFMISELSVLPFNVIWYLSKLGFSQKSRAMRIALLARAIGFVVLRAPIAPFAATYAIKNTPGGLSEIVRRLAYETHKVVTGGITVNFTVFSIINLVWTLQAIRVSRGRKND